MSEPTKITLTTAHAGKRLDQVLSELYPDYSRSHLARCIEREFVLLNNKPSRKNARVESGSELTVLEHELHRSFLPPLTAENVALDVIYEDAEIMAVNKPAGMVVHPGSGNREGTLVNALLGREGSLSSGSAWDRPGIVHRLDKETSGILLVAKSNVAHEKLSSVFAARKVRKHYLGICLGEHPKETGRIEGPIGRRRTDPVRLGIRRGGKDAVTEYDLLSYEYGISLLHFRPLTGRTHQIRVHCASQGFPIIKDGLYGNENVEVLKVPPLQRPFVYKVLGSFARQALHAYAIEFSHPTTGAPLLLRAPLPDDFEHGLDILGEDVRERVQRIGD